MTEKCRYTHFLTTSTHAPSIYLVMPFIEHDLKTILDSLSEPFLPSETKLLLSQLTSALAYLHDQHILHRDLKTSNLLLNNLGELKLADFGMARYTSNPPPRHLTQLVVTLWYRAPELLLGTKTYTSAIDIWSLGCIFGELLTSQPLLPAKNEVSLLSSIFTLLGTPTTASWPHFRSLPNTKALYPLLSNNTAQPPATLLQNKFPYLSSTGLSLLKACLSLNPDHRPSAAEVLSHPYFSEDPRAKPKEMFPTFPSKGGLEKRRKLATPQAPIRGEAPRIDEREVQGLFGSDGQEVKGAGWSLKV
jgi:cell division cycle 2-like